jgi:ribosomal protein S18 acetylase RimI-like enzyme
MLWRVRTSLPDRPGALALLAERCGHADINILGLQIFPGVDSVTDEVVLRAPDEWDPERIVALVEASGGRSVRVTRCSEAALSDQPTRYVQAARAIVDKPTSFPEVVARLFDADVEPPAEDTDADVMELTVVDAQVEVRRATPFTATEHARGAAMAALVSDALTRQPAPVTPTPDSETATPDYVTDPDAERAVRAMVDGVAIGWATVAELPGEDDVLLVDLEVDAAWQRRGIGSRLLLDAARLANGRGAGEVLLSTASDNPAVLPMVLAAGLRGRIRMAGDQLTVRVPVREVRPLTS